MFNRSGRKKLRKTPRGRGVSSIPPRPRVKYDFKTKLLAAHPLIAIPHTHVLKSSDRTDTIFMTQNSEIEYPDKDSKP